MDRMKEIDEQYLKRLEEIEQNYRKNMAELRRESQRKMAEIKAKYIRKKIPIKKLLNMETRWTVLKTLALEDLYSVRHFRGKDTGIECYAVALGSTILSVHFSKEEALRNWNAHLNAECAQLNDTWELDDF